MTQMNQPPKEMSDVEKAELILRGHCAECFLGPGAHQDWCRAGLRERIAMIVNTLARVGTSSRGSGPVN